MNVRRLIKRMILWQGFVVHRNRDSKVLFYHDVGLNYTNMGTPFELIQSHIKTIKNCGFTIVDSITEKENQVLLCFDDGWLGIYDLKQYFIDEKIRPTIFVAVELIGTKGHLNIGQILELAREGFHFETHSWSHDDLSICDDRELKHELFDSKLELEKLLSMKFDAICYPQGYYNEKVIESAKDAGYQRQFSSIWGGYYDRLNIDGVICRILAQDLSNSEVKYSLLGASPFFTQRYIKQHIKNSNND